MYAVRNLRLCTKDCLCLYVCPTGATDTENGQVDAKKCIGCGLCVKACPSHALSLDVYKRQAAGDRARVPAAGGKAGPAAGDLAVRPYFFKRAVHAGFPSARF